LYPLRLGYFKHHILFSKYDYFSDGKSPFNNEYSYENKKTAFLRISGTKKYLIKKAHKG
jgi:hypothetical protein